MDDEIKNLVLIEIENIMRKFGKSLQDYEAMSFLDMTNALYMQNKLVTQRIKI